MDLSYKLKENFYPNNEYVNVNKQQTPAGCAYHGRKLQQQ